MFEAHDFPNLIHGLQSELDRLPSGDALARQTKAVELAHRHLLHPHEFLDWAKRERHWSFTLAEVMRESCAKPSELAASLLVAILVELDEERELSGPVVRVARADELAAGPADGNLFARPSLADV